MSIISEPNFDFSINDLSSAEQIAFYEYWQKIKNTKSMPNRSAFKPMDIPKVLPFIFMEEVEHNPLRYKVRLIGSKSDVPNEHTGKYLDEIPDLDAVISSLDELVKVKKPYYYERKMTLANGATKRYSSVVVPFSEDDDEVNIIMSCHAVIRM